jgi:hypothetical protein
VATPPALKDLASPEKAITTFSSALMFPESLDAGEAVYGEAIHEFATLVSKSATSEALLRAIRDSSYRAKARMSLLKIFRRCVSPVCDTERAKKVATVTTDSIIESCGNTFKSIDVLKAQFKEPLSREVVFSLSVLLAENDSRGQSGYALTAAFFDWFPAQPQFKGLTVRGPRGAGSDIQLSTLIPEFDTNYPCDVVITDEGDKVLAVGFARYDATRGGSQSDDRTGGNSNKVDKARIYFEKEGGRPFRLLFLSDGPGLLHGDTWREACALDGALNGAVRVTTLKLAPDRVTAEWLKGQPE